MPGALWFCSQVDSWNIKSCVTKVRLWLLIKKKNMLLEILTFYENWFIKKRVLKKKSKSKISLRYTNTDLEISLYVCVHVKPVPWKFHILNSKNYRVFAREVCKFLKK